MQTIGTSLLAASWCSVTCLLIPVQDSRSLHGFCTELLYETAAPDQGMAKSGTGVTSSCLLGSVVVVVVLQERCDTGRKRVGSADLAKLG